MTPKILCIIPARGGSKGVPRKNIRMIAGKPLIAYTIEAALTSGVVDKLVVSTEDSEIAQIARSFGAEVIDRPAELASDTATNEAVMLHAVEFLEAEGYAPTHVGLIQPTSPFLTNDVIKEAVKRITDEGFDTAITVFYPQGFEFKWHKHEEGHLVPDNDPMKRPFRQTLKLPWHENGAFYLTGAEHFKKNQNRFGGRDTRVAPVEMSEMDSLQIDSPHHLWLAEQYMIWKNQQRNEE